MSDLWTSFIVNVLVGTFAGGITNAVAVWMLFHPYERRFGLHGAIPKNKERLARSIGRTVGEKLLTPSDVLAEIERSGLRDAVQERIAIVVTRLLEQERGSLRDLLPPSLFAEVEKAVAALGDSFAQRYVGYVNDDDFELMVRKFVAAARAQVSRVPLAEILTPERRAALAQQAASMSTDLIAEARDDSNQSARARIGHFLLQLAGAERTERFVERTVADALERTEHRTIGDIIDTIPDETYVEWILRAARSPRAAELALGAAGTSARSLLDTPIGKPSRWLPPEAAQRIAATAAPALWEWSVAQIPGFVERLDIEGMVERKVLGFSTKRIEEVIRNVTEKELQLIVQLGYVLGAVIGAATFLVGLAFR
ncbi:MAG TPA: DUF445 family protein [Gemmatimonadaceae bacterium]|nr:DUF445 family protein [Gemmatimonadaceae bacterium]